VSDAVQGREVARRLFAAEFDDATLSYSEGDDERAPNYVVTPTGARANRLFAVGALTEVEQVNEEIVRGRVADPTGVFVTYAGQYQPDAMGFLDRATPPCFVSLTGKARTYQPDDSDRIFTSVRPESLNEVDADTRDRWVVAAAEATLERVATMAAALALDVRGDDLTAALESRGVESALAQGVALAVEHYEPTEHYLEGIRQMAVEALELVAGERESVDAPTAAPSDPGSRTVGPLPTVAAASAAPGDTAAAVDPEAVDEGGAAVAADDAAADDAVADESDASVESDESTETDETIDESDGTTDETAEDSETGNDPAVAAADAASESADETASTAASDSDSESTTTDTDESTGADASESPATAASEAEPAVDDSAADADTLDDFAPESGDGESEADGLDDEADEPADLDSDEMYELDDEERAEIESEYGTEFSTGNEVDAPGEADIDVPDVDELEEEVDDAAGESPAADSGGETTAADTDDSTDEVAAGSAESVSDESADSVPDESADTAADADSDAPSDADLEDAAVSVMADLDDGDGADREAVVAAVVEEYSADPDDVEAAIKEALMGGKCYEPTEGTLKSI